MAPGLVGEPLNVSMPTEAVPSDAPTPLDAPLPPELAPPAVDWDVPAPVENLDEPVEILDKPTPSPSDVISPDDPSGLMDDAVKTDDEPIEAPPQDEAEATMRDSSVRFASYSMLQAVMPIQTQAAPSAGEVRHSVLIERFAPASESFDSDSPDQECGMEQQERREFLEALRAAFAPTTPRPLPCETEAAMRLGS